MGLLERMLHLRIIQLVECTTVGIYISIYCYREVAGSIPAVEILCCLVKQDKKKYIVNRMGYDTNAIIRGVAKLLEKFDEDPETVMSRKVLYDGEMINEMNLKSILQGGRRRAKTRRSKAKRSRHASRSRK